MNTINQELRMEAMKWWIYKSFMEKFMLMCKYEDSIAGSPRFPDSLTGREIEQLYIKELA